MRYHGISPYISDSSNNISNTNEKTYQELDSIQIGLDVCKSRKLINVMGTDTKYSLTAKGLEFIEP